MISDARIYNILIAPVVTEKSNLEQTKRNTYVFKVATDATKEEIKAAVQKIFKVAKVLSVRTLNVQGKTRRTVHGIGKRSDWKKAYVRLPEGVTLDVSAANVQADKESK
ncbi:MAG: 50S ribosomal protein L23 [Succinivibrio sp.]|jgi:large subunit ribosomal protein L23|nr:50S ribosomal protein L23 [Succinivibrio sp.]